MKLHFTILPPSKMSQWSVRLAKRLTTKYECWFVVNNKNLYPHVTLFSAQVPKKQFASLSDSLENLAARFSALDLQIVGLSTPRATGGGWMALKIKSNNHLTKFREQVRKLVSGKIRFKPYYNPHITLAKYKNPRDERSVRSQTKLPTKKFRAKILAVCVSDAEFSQVYKILKKYELK